ncbi:MAG: copper-translocating P-type ATPase [Candidatus Nanopelagicales bacterium]|nr:copper-translocating P-type ATPase [Candidatus Nanopelagicales bacterium]
MTCTSCAQRVQTKLNQLPGVAASVNYATESAHIDFTAQYQVADFVKAIQEAGYDAIAPEFQSHVDEAIENDGIRIRRHFWFSFALAIPVVLLSMIPILQFSGWQWLVFVLSTPVVFWGAWPFHRVAWLNLRHGTANMDTLISLGTFAAYFWSVWALLLGGSGALTYRATHSLFVGAMADMGQAPALYFEVAAALPVFVLAGRWFESRAKRNSSSAMRALLSLRIDRATVWRDGIEVEVPLAELIVSDIFVTKPGERIATDGEVIDGESSVDEALLTGESVPVSVGPGSSVVGATVNLDGRLLVRATGVGEQTKLAQIARLVAAAQSGKAPIQRLVDRVAAVFVPIVLGLALLTLISWLLVTGDAQAAFAAAVAVVIIACPCALGLATPLALLVGTGRGAQMGIVLRGPETLEQSRRIDAMVLDKTGTITTGVMAVQSVTVAPGRDGDAVLNLAARVESYSEHPLAQAIVLAADAVVPVTEISGFISSPGRGATATIEEVLVRIGQPRWVLEQINQAAAPWFDEAMREATTAGSAVVAIAGNDELLGLISLADTVRPTSRRAVGELNRIGIAVTMLSGDSIAVAAKVASQVGITDIVADVQPAEKVAVIVAAQQAGKVVAMVGDGVNDAAALVRADLGIAMSTGSDVAIEASDITLVRNDLLAAVDAIRLSRRTLRIIKGNLFWAFAYNIAMIPLAAVGLLNPLLAGAAMAFSSVFVVANSLRLRGFQSISGKAS